MYLAEPEIGPPVSPAKRKADQNNGMGVSEETFLSIQSELARIESDYGVRVLYACESGSRSWGFDSPDSDYDVRFLYVHARDWYLSIETGRDVIEEMLPGDLDLSGWELRKGLRLMRKSNPPFYEWLRAPIVYRQDAKFMARLQPLATDYYSPERCFLHYLHMAQGNIREYLSGETVWLKKYLYVLRPMLACRWIERGLGPAPMEFERLVARGVEDPNLIAAIQSLLSRKREGAELDRGPFIPEISRFIAEEMPRLGAIKPKPGPSPDAAALDGLFRETIGL